MYSSFYPSSSYTVMYTACEGLNFIIHTCHYEVKQANVQKTLFMWLTITRQVCPQCPKMLLASSNYHIFLATGHLSAHLVVIQNVLYFLCYVIICTHVCIDRYKIAHAQKQPRSGQNMMLCTNLLFPQFSKRWCYVLFVQCCLVT